MSSRLLATESAGPRLVFSGAVSFCDELEGRTAAKARAGKRARSAEICMVKSAAFKNDWLEEFGLMQRERATINWWKCCERYEETRAMILENKELRFCCEVEERIGCWTDRQKNQTPGGRSLYIISREFVSSTKSHRSIATNVAHSGSTALCGVKIESFGDRAVKIWK